MSQENYNWRKMQLLRSNNASPIVSLSFGTATVMHKFRSLTSFCSSFFVLDHFWYTIPHYVVPYYVVKCNDKFMLTPQRIAASCHCFGSVCKGPVIVISQHHVIVLDLFVKDL